MAKEVKRETKFRMWSIKDRFMDDTPVVYKGAPCTIDTEGKVVWMPQEDTILMQFTGLLDKNGKEIYEGDIVRQGVVEFKFGKWLIVNKQDDLKTKILYDTIHDTNEQEIIGNIYENPNLLTN